MAYMYSRMGLEVSVQLRSSSECVHYCRQTPLEYNLMGERWRSSKIFSSRREMSDNVFNILAESGGRSIYAFSKLW